MRVMICYPPLPANKGIPQWGQNRQFQYFSHPTYIYPIVPASGATLLENNEFEVYWSDGVAQSWSYEFFLRHFREVNPELVVMEAKTPIIKQLWSIINELKAEKPDAKFVLTGDHVTALPKESLERSKVDYVLTGGDWDFSLLKLAQHLRGDFHLPKGLWYRGGGNIKNTGSFELTKNLDELPFIDRDLTEWQLYYENWYKRKPFTYTMAGRDCWWRRDGGCTFCAWTVLYPEFRVRSPERHLDEVGNLIEKYHVREIFDDTGTFPSGKWLKKFCEGMIERGYNDEVLFSCNFRYDQISRDVCKLMKKAGFRLLKVGLESASQETLDRINKGVRVQQIIDGSKIAKEAGLDIHLTIMVGYPWETSDDAVRTLMLAKKLMEDGHADVLQSTIVTPYPGTKLYQQALEFDWFRIDPQDYDRYDMTEPPLKTEGMTSEEVVRICDEIYRIYLSPKYVLRRLIKSLSSLDDLVLSLRGAKAAIGHVRDFTATS
jgi:anaerobic magnesium-protoporphyrin IX monomethyl ester cyclase